MRCFSRIFFAFVALAALPAQASESAWRSADYLQARLVSAGARDGAVSAALEVRLAEGWHAYWRMPGDGGLPPALDWEKSRNLAGAEMLWPAPQRFSEAGLNSFGYEGTVIFPLVLKAEDPQKPLDLALDASIMVCRDICVPQAVTLTHAVPAGENDARYAAVIAKASESVPAAENTPSLKIESAVIGPDAVVVRAFSQAAFADADLFVESGDLYLTAPPEITPDAADGRYATLRVAKPQGVENLAAAVMDMPIVLTLTAGDRAVEKKIKF